MSLQNIESIWFKDPYSFFTNFQDYIVFIPDSSMSYEEQLNVSLRFAIYFSIAVFIVKRDYRIFFFIAFVGLLTVVLYETKQSKNVKDREIFDNIGVDYEPKKKRACMKPSKSNPFMNVTFADYESFPNRPPACNIGNKKVKDKVSQFFDDELPRNVDDIFHNQSSDRQYYSNPSTTIPNDQASFAKWLYKVDKTCKEDGIACKGYP